MSHIYSDDFFDYIDRGARRSAARVIGLLYPWLKPDSVIDLGSGRGVWLDEWKNAGAREVLGLDGSYVDRDQLAIQKSEFEAVDLTKPQSLQRRFDLAQSLEVGEHLPEDAAIVLVDSLVKHSDRVLFSAAVKGQGGEFHVNEQPLRYWQKLFEDRGYSAFDCVRPHLSNEKSVEPWYRYNSILYANETGQLGLPDVVVSTRVVDPLRDAGSAQWRLRKTVVRTLPRPVVTAIAKGRAALIARRARKH